MLTVGWRGDETEIEALQLLAKLYTDGQRYRDAFLIMRTALVVHPGSDLTRRIHDDAAATFDQLFLAGKGDGLPPIDALGLFYDFRDLTPVGRRGDEMIRRLADRLWPSTCSIRRRRCCSIRSTTGCRARRAPRSRPGLR